MATAEKKYEVVLLNDHVFIGMEDVSITYRPRLVAKDVSLENVRAIVKEGFEDWNNDKTVIREKELRASGNPPYYPESHNAPCRAIVAPTGVLESTKLSNYRNIAEACALGAVDFCFSAEYEVLQEKLTELGNA